MRELLNLLAAIALLVWGTHSVRKGVTRLLGEDLRRVLAHSFGNRAKSLFAGMCVTSLVQSSTATCLMLASFAGKGLVSTGPALAVMLGADIGTALMAAVYSFDLSWVSPLFIFVGVVLFVSRQNSKAGRIGRVLIGLGLITLALQLIVSSTRPVVDAPTMRTLLASLPSDRLLDIIVGALITIMAYSSLAIVLLTATLASSGLLTLPVALGLVIGANVGSAVLAFLATAGEGPQARRVPLGNLMFKLGGGMIAIPFVDHAQVLLAGLDLSVAQQVVGFHLGFNLVLAVLAIGLTNKVGELAERLLPQPRMALDERQSHLDRGALDTPSLAIHCAAREALYQADLVETMLRGVLEVIRTNDQAMSKKLRSMDDKVDDLYTAIKFYLTQISRESLDEREGRRWNDIVSFSINMEQAADIIERILQDVEEKKIKKGRSFSDAGMSEIALMHEQLLGNLRLAMSVFLDGDVRDAEKLLEEKARFRELERTFAANHLSRLQDNTTLSIETSSLHLELITELKRINSLLCSVAYPILETTGALAATRLRSASESNAS